MTMPEIMDALRKARKTGKRVRITCTDGIQGECLVTQLCEDVFRLDPSPELIKACNWEGWGTDVCIDYDDLAAVEFVE